MCEPPPRGLRAAKTTVVHTRGAYERPKGAIDAETSASLDAAAVPPRSDLEENQSAAGGRILRFDHREEKHGNRHASWSAILQFHKGYGARFKTYLRELIRGDVALTWVTTERWNRKGCQ